MKDNLNKILFFPPRGWNPETKFKTDHIKIIYIYIVNLNIFPFFFISNKMIQYVLT